MLKQLPNLPMRPHSPALTLKCPLHHSLGHCEQQCLQADNQMKQQSPEESQKSQLRLRQPHIHNVAPQYLHLQQGQPAETIGHLINNITFVKRGRAPRTDWPGSQEASETSSRESISSFECEVAGTKVELSKSWSQSEEALFRDLLAKHGTDFNIIKQFFPKKTKNQIKTKYKLISDTRGPPARRPPKHSSKKQLEVGLNNTIKQEQCLAPQNQTINQQLPQSWHRK